FEKEVLAIARLRHPNIVTAHDCSRQGGLLFLVMELLEGKTLEDWVQERGPLSEALAWAVARQAAAGVAPPGEVGIVHRDVKPANLFLVEPPAGSTLPAGVPGVKVTDFGLALLASDPSPGGRLTQAGSLLGTPAYMAPEQFGGSSVDSRADIY